MKINQRLASIILATFAPTIVCAQSPPAISDPTDGVFQLQKCISSYQALLHSDNPDTRAAAIERGLPESSVAVRGAVISAALSRFTALTPQVIGDKGSPAGLGMIPDFAMLSIRWSKDGHSFTDLGGCCDQLVQGQILGGGMNLRYEKVAIDKVLFKANFDHDPSDIKVENAVCTVFLKVDETKQNLSGPVTCQNLPIKFLMTIPLGG